MIKFFGHTYLSRVRKHYVEDADYVIQRHIYNRSQMRDLVNRPFFRESAIKDCLAMGSNYETRSYETALYDRENQEEFKWYSSNTF